MNSNGKSIMDKENQKNPSLIDLTDEEIPEIYVSGFTAGFSNADILIQWTRNGKNVLNMNMSFTLAKTLSQILGNTVSDIENTADFEIKSTKDFDDAFKKAVNKGE